MAKEKILAVLFLLILLGPMALASVTVTWNAPADGSTYSTLSGNRRTIDLNFTVDDDNTSTNNDTNIRVTWRSVHTLQGDSATFIIGSAAADVNVFATDYNNTRASNGLLCVSQDEYGEPIYCSLTFSFPSNTTMPQGSYIFDVNAEGYYPTCAGGGCDPITADANASITINIENHLPNRGTIRDLMVIVGMILAGVVLLGGLGAIVVFKLDPVKTALITVAAAIAVGIGSQIIGVVLAAL